MRIIDGSTAYLVLQYLSQVGSIPRKNLYTAFQESVTYNHFSQITKRLIDEEYLEVFRKDELNHIKIADKGYKILKEKISNNQSEEEAIYFDKTLAKPRNEKEKKRFELVAGVIGLCESNSIITKENEKPQLSSFFSPKTKEELEEVKRVIQEGVFYSTREIRKAYLEHDGVGTEFANWSRLIGIVFIENKLTFIYSINDTLIRWISTCEKRTIETIIDFLLKSAIINKYVMIPKKPNCIIVGKGYSMIPKLVYGRKWGNLKSKKGTEKFQAKLSKDNINAHNLSKVFSVAYYVTIDRKGKNPFKVALKLDDKTKRCLVDNWYSKMTKIVELKTERYCQGMMPNHERIIYMPYIDIIELEYYRKQGIPAHFVILTGTQDAVSRVMGPNILSAKNINGNHLKFERYNKDGLPINPTAFQRHAGKKNLGGGNKK